MDDKPMVCSQCEQGIVKDKSYLIFKIIANTEEKEYEIGISRILHDLNEYGMKKGYHLSGSEMLLLRPDIVLQFLKETQKEEVIEWHLEHYYICFECYEVYTELIPLI